MISTDKYIEIKTDDGKQLKLPLEIQNFSTLFKDLIQNYEINKDEKINNIKSNDVKKLIDFCESIEYKRIKFDKPYWMYSIEHQTNKMCQKTKIFYNNILNENSINDYIRLADFYDVLELEEIIYLKLYELYGNKDKIIVSELLKKQNNLKERIEINQERLKFLRLKYSYYIDQQLNELNEKDINDLCNKLYK